MSSTPSGAPAILSCVLPLPLVPPHHSRVPPQWDLHAEAPDLFLHLSRAALVLFKGDLNHRKLTYDCAAPSTTPFDEAIGPMANVAGAPRVCSMRTIKVRCALFDSKDGVLMIFIHLSVGLQSDVVVGLPDEEIAERLDKEEPGWKISGKYVSSRFFSSLLSASLLRALPYPVPHI